jgi:flagellar basal body rod protein FlgG
MSSGLLPALDGLLHSSVQFDQAARRMVRASLPPADTVDLSTAAVALLQSRNNFDANIKMFQVADEMAKTTIDSIG